MTQPLDDLPTVPKELLDMARDPRLANLRELDPGEPRTNCRQGGARRTELK